MKNIFIFSAFQTFYVKLSAVSVCHRWDSCIATCSYGSILIATPFLWLSIDVTLLCRSFKKKKEAKSLRRQNKLRNDAHTL